MTQNRNPRAAVRLAIDLALATAAILTAVLIVRTYWYLFHSVSNTPFTDTWLYLDTVRKFHSGEAGWASLWSTYWGHRPVLPRLLFLWSLKFDAFRAMPLFLINLAALLFMLSILIRASFRALRGHPRLAWAASIAFANLVLSSLGMECLIPQDTVCTIAYAASVGAVILFAEWPIAAILLGIAATASMNIGLLVWPILFVEAWLLQKPMRMRWTLGALNVLIFVAYLTNYQRPEFLGMGASGALHHPLDFLHMLALVLGGPITLYSLNLGTVAGAVGLAVFAPLAGGWFAARAGAKIAQNHGDFAVIFACLLLISIAVAMVAGRISPEYIAQLHGAQPLPSRYLVPIMVFWGCLFTLALPGLKSINPRATMTAIITGIVIIIMMFGTWSWQWRLSREWAVYFQKYDAIGSAFLAQVSDPQLMQLLLSDVPKRDELVDYMRRERLAMFSEPRANWIGRPVKQILKQQSVGSCDAVIAREPVVNGFRITGRINLGNRRSARQDDVLIINRAGIVAGLGRTLPVESEFLPQVEFLAYSREPGERLIVRLSEHSFCESDAGRVAAVQPPGEAIRRVRRSQDRR